MNKHTSSGIRIRQPGSSAVNTPCFVNIHEYSLPSTHHCQSASSGLLSIEGIPLSSRWPMPQAVMMTVTGQL